MNRVAYRRPRARGRGAVQARRMRAPSTPAWNCPLVHADGRSCRGPTTCPAQINRAPVLGPWAAVVAEPLGFNRDKALRLGRAVAGLDAHATGVSIGLYRPPSPEVRDRRAARA